MSNTSSRRLTALALCALLGLTATANASVLMRDADGGSTLVSRAPELSATDYLTWKGNFSFFSFEQYDQRKREIHQALGDMGFRYAWQGNFGEGTVSVWYSATLDKTLVCLESVTDTSLTHQTYPMNGKLSRNDSFLW